MCLDVEEWTFLTNHAHTLLCIAAIPVSGYAKAAATTTEFEQTDRYAIPWNGGTASARFSRSCTNRRIPRRPADLLHTGTDWTQCG